MAEGAALTTDKFCCPHCGVWKSRVVDSRPDTEGMRYLRWRHCAGCHQLFETAELATGKTIPLHPEVHATRLGRRAGMTSTADRFHFHIDACAQCRTQPYALCSIGTALLQGSGIDRVGLETFALGRVVSHLQDALAAALATGCEADAREAVQWARDAARRARALEPHLYPRPLARTA